MRCVLKRILSLVFRGRFLLCVVVATSWVSLLEAQPQPVKNTVNPKVIHIAVHRYYPFYVDGVGMGADIFTAAFTTQGIKVVLHELPVLRGVSEMLNHHVDAFSPGTLFIRDKTSLARVTTVSTFIVHVSWLYKGNNNPLEIENMQGTILATPTPVQTPQPYYKPFLARGMRQLTVESPERQVRLVMTERADFAPMSKLTGWHMLVKYSPNNYQNYAFAPVMKPYECNLAFATDNPRSMPLIMAFKRGLKKIMDDGTYLKILEKYWGKENIPKGNLFDELKDKGTDNFNPRLLLKVLGH